MSGRKSRKILFESRPVPIKHVVAAPNVPQSDVEPNRALFPGLDQTKEGRAVLQKLGFQGYMKPNDAQTVEPTSWLGI